jgi:hypothetical protein
MRIPRPTYGSVTATIALFAALAGTSYAAVTISGSNIKNGTLTGADLKNESVKGSDIDNGSLTGSDLKSGSVTSSDIADGSLLAGDFRAGELPAGPAGPAGPQGPGGLSDVVVRRSDVTVAASSEQEAAASCANGEIAVGGGVGHSGTVAENIAALYGFPQKADGSLPQDGDRAGRWLAGVNSNVGAPRTMTVYVLCTKP